jgi:hypothetical protein
VRARPGITSAEIADVLGEQVPRRTRKAHRLRSDPASAPEAATQDRHRTRRCESGGARVAQHELPGACASLLVVCAEIYYSGAGNLLALLLQNVASQRPARAACRGRHSDEWHAAVAVPRSVRASPCASRLASAS